MRRLLSCLAVAAVTTAGCTSGSDEAAPEEDFQPAAAPQIEVDLLQELDEPVRVGVVLTSSGPRGEGAEFAALAAGARVAEFRLDEPDADRVQLEVVDDRGTAEGALAATEQLVTSGVAGIVYASAGAHLDPALAAAEVAGTAVLLPYDPRESAAGATTWRTGPSEGQVADRVAELLAERAQRAPLVLTAEGQGAGLPELADPSRVAALTAGDALVPQVSSAAAALTSGGADGVVVAASAPTSAETVAALQAVAPTVPVVLGPAALAPAFAGTLTDLGASGGATTAGQFFTVGPAATDTSAEDGVVRFLAAVRLAAQDVELTSLDGATGFGQAGAATADVRGHDAVLAIAAAAAAAGSASPSAVLDALRELDLDAADGLAGPALSFTAGSQALDDDGVAVLQGTTRGAGRGVEEDAPALSWFVLPTGTP
ncbi:ABC transporter substrate-binding protein [Blastococcus haudaquaticus]|uniref:Substrate-binding protein n=1 Tax=Blastococcus haudaquaticus TaxID=1938745 RepID=A0A286H114_9ACTN|nr:ABC transporter substrate-binding protein [Blastococcus haudaquaticus]SOE01463.1 substrate-binding protein [Blastococcus haudaquaticus]